MKKQLVGNKGMLHILVKKSVMAIIWYVKASNSIEIFRDIRKNWTLPPNEVFVKTRAIHHYWRISTRIEIKPIME